MNQPENSIQILLLCQNENSAHLDKKALRAAGFPKPSIMTSGIQAAKLLAGQLEADQPRPDLVICTQKLYDMDGERFCAIIRQHRDLLTFPVLLIAPSETLARQLKTLGCGASSVLGRPFSMEKLKATILAMLAVKPPLPRIKPDISAFESAIASHGLLLGQERAPADYFQLGMACLKEERWNDALSAFEQALADEKIRGDIELGMAAAWKGKADLARFRVCLARASENFTRQKRWHLARTSYARLLQHDPGARNPLLTEAHRQIKMKSWQNAAEIIKYALSMLPKNQKADRIARLCFTAEDPEAMFQTLKNYLAQEQVKNSAQLCSEIRSSLDNFIQERNDRQKQLAAERKWQLAQAMEKAKKSALPLQNQQSSPKPAQAPFVEELEEADDKFYSYAEDMEEESLERPALDFMETPDKTQAPAKKKGLNDLLSVIKFTWTMSRKADKKS